MAPQRPRRWADELGQEMLQKDDTTARMTEGAPPFAAALHAPAGVSDVLPQVDERLAPRLLVKAVLDRVGAVLLVVLGPPGRLPTASAAWVGSPRPAPRSRH